MADKLGMAAALDDLAVIQHQDFVGIHHRGKPVRDDQRGAVPGDLAQRALDFAFGAGVQRGRRFVQQQDRRVLQDGAGDGDALLLAAGKFQPALAHHGFIAQRQFEDELVDLGHGARRP